MRRVASRRWRRSTVTRSRSFIEKDFPKSVPTPNERGKQTQHLEPAREIACCSRRTRFSSRRKSMTSSWRELIQPASQRPGTAQPRYPSRRHGTRLVIHLRVRLAMASRGDASRFPLDDLSSSPGRHRPGPSPDPDEEIYTIRLFCRVDLRTSPDLHPDLGLWEWLHFE